MAGTELKAHPAVIHLRVQLLAEKSRGALQAGGDPAFIHCFTLFSCE